MRSLLTLLLLTAALPAAAQFYADDPPGPGGLTLGFRGAYGMPMGEFAGRSDGSTMKLRDEFSGQFPFWMEAAVRFGERYLAGVDLQIGYPLLVKEGPGLAAAECHVAGVASCNGNVDVRFGLEFLVNLLPEQKVQPWVGVGASFGRIAYVLKDAAGGSAIVSYSYKEFLGLQAGVDVRVKARVAVGPFASLAFGRYDEVKISSGDVTVGSFTLADKRVHAWLQLGLKAIVDL